MASSVHSENMVRITFVTAADLLIHQKVVLAHRQKSEDVNRQRQNGNATLGSG